MLALGCLALLAGCGGEPVTTEADGSAEPDAALPPVERPAIDPALERRRAVGELLMVSFEGTVAPTEILDALRKRSIGGVILFSDNVVDEDQLRGLTKRLQRAAKGRALIAVDQEGGAVRIVPFAAPEDPASAQAAEAGAAARDTARDLDRLGINVNLAPVADIASDGSFLGARAFGSDPDAVAEAVVDSVRAHAAAGVAATVKHFPGLGRAAENTDEAAVEIDASRGDLERSDLVPFRAAAKADSPLMMLGHATYPALDARNVASRSPAVIDLLREELGYEGVIITDSLEAKGSLGDGATSVGRAARESVAAGVDIVLMTGSASWGPARTELLARARHDEDFAARVEESAARVETLKVELGLLDP